MQTDQELFPTTKNPPNVFYIILDAYGGQQALQEFYNFDNSEFLNQLNERNFNTIDNSKSNYAFTFLSLPASLNMKYLDNYEKNELGNNMELTYDMIPDNQVMKNFKNMDYQIVTVSSGWGTTRNFELSDISYCGTFNLIDSSQILVSILDNSIFKSVYPKLFSDDRLKTPQGQQMLDALFKYTSVGIDRSGSINLNKITQHVEWYSVSLGASGDLQYTLIDVIDSIDFADLNAYKVDKEIFTPSFILKRMYDVKESYSTLDLFANIISMFKNGEKLYKTSDVLDKESVAQRLSSEKIDNLRRNLEDVYKFVQGRPVVLI